MRIIVNLSLTLGRFICINIYEGVSAGAGAYLELCDLTQAKLLYYRQFQNLLLRTSFLYLFYCPLVKKERRWILFNQQII